MNILITNIGRRGYLVDFIKENADFKGKVFVSDCDNTASGLYGTNDGFFILPKPVENDCTQSLRYNHIYQRRIKTNEKPI